VTRYDLAGMFARSGQNDEAFSLLRQAIDHGLPPRLALDSVKDPWLDPLHSDRRFSALVAHVKERFGSQPAN
jgi:hypothetical protein